MQKKFSVHASNPNVGAPTADNPKYIEWLESESLLHNAEIMATTVSGKGMQWQGEYTEPQAKNAVDMAPVWFNSYPISTIAGEGETFFTVFSDEDLWRAFEEIGIQCLHTGPVKVAGGVKGTEYTPTVDGFFDRINLIIAPEFGTDEDYRNMVEVAKRFNAIIAGDIVPGHTGKGPDFRLAERNYKDYPGAYVMVAIDPADWHLLPDVEDEWESENISPEVVDQLTEKGYIPGRLQRVLFSVPGETKALTGWDATAEIKGVDGIVRRWVYLHYFKPGQPTMNWLDPSYTSSRIISGDLIKTIHILGAKVVRLDANSFLGIERRLGEKVSWSEGHPLSVIASNNIAFMTRKLGGKSFQELNLSLDSIQAFSEQGSDLSYDFVTRPAAPHALLTGDATFLRLTLDLMKKYNLDPKIMIHDMQNHDEFTYELVHFDEHADDVFDFGGLPMRGRQIFEKIRGEMNEKAMGPDTPYNRLSGNGLCTTFAGLMASRLRIKDLDTITDEQKKLIQKGHYLMAVYNAMQPGVFGLSGWDLVGSLPLNVDQIPALLEDGDFRWINRGSFDLMGRNSDIECSADGIPRPKELYGSLPDQLADPDSFVSQLKRLLAKRSEYNIHVAKHLSSAPVMHKGSTLLVHELPETKQIQVTALNFGDKEVTEKIYLSRETGKDLKWLAGKNIIDIMSGEIVGTVEQGGLMEIKLPPLESQVLIIE